MAGRPPSPKPLATAVQPATSVIAPVDQAPVPVTPDPAPVPVSRTARFRHVTLEQARHQLATDERLNPAQWSRLWNQLRHLDNQVTAFEAYGGLDKALELLVSAGMATVPRE